MTSSSSLPAKPPAKPRRSREELDADCVDVMLFLGRMSAPQLRTDVYVTRVCGGDTRRVDTALRACVRTGRVLQVVQPGKHDLFQLAPIRQALTGRAESQAPLFVVVPARSPHGVARVEVSAALADVEPEVVPAGLVGPVEVDSEHALAPDEPSEVGPASRKPRVFRKPEVRRADRRAALRDVLRHGPSRSGEVARRIGVDAGYVERDLFALTKTLHPGDLQSPEELARKVRLGRFPGAWTGCLLDRVVIDGSMIYRIAPEVGGLEAVEAELEIGDPRVTRPGEASSVQPAIPAPGDGQEDRVESGDVVRTVEDKVSAPGVTPLSGASFAEVGRIMDDARDRGADPLDALLARWYTGEPEIAAACATIAGYEVALEALRVARDEAARVLRLQRERAHRDLVALFEAGLRGTRT